MDAEMKPKIRRYKNDKEWSDCFLPQIKQILRLYLINEAPIEEENVFYDKYR